MLWTSWRCAGLTNPRLQIEHQYVDLTTGQYVGPGGVGPDLVEGFFSQLKRSIDGTHHHVRREHLGRYLAQFDSSTATASTPTDSGCSCCLATWPAVSSRISSDEPFVGLSTRNGMGWPT
jgi:hypothetical protein